MQQLNENLEDLFRKAAENYPLNSNAANWDIIANKLKGAQQAIPIENTNNNRRSYILIVLLLLVIPSVCFLYNKGSKNTDQTGVRNFTQNRLQKESNKENIEKNRSKTNISKEDFANNYYSDVQLKKEAVAQKSAKKYLFRRDDFSGIKPKGSYKVTGQVNPEKVAEPANVESSTKSGDYINIIETESDKEKAAKSETESLSNSETSASSANADKLINSETHENASESLKKAPIILSKKEKSFYIGLTGGPQVATVKLQNIQKPSLRYGILAGYKFNEKWGLEFAILRSQLYYNTSANYFSSDDLKFRPTTTINGIDGYNYITEFPLSVKYNFPVSKKQHQYFLTAGISSQIMNSEKYWYQLNKDNRKDTTILKLYDRNGNLQLFSGLQFTAGYEMPLLNNKAILRIEPFVKFPVRGAGIGNVRVSTFGLSLGITKKL